MWALGAFTGATVSGVLFDIVGFRTGSVSILGLQLVVVFNYMSLKVKNAIKNLICLFYFTGRFNFIVHVRIINVIMLH